jgi:phospholipase/lecithinase/hemolysin
MKSMESSNKKHRKTLLRVAQTAIAGGAFALLTACGGGNNDPAALAPPSGGVTLQTVSFGDSLSDVGTYAWYARPNFGGGEFTTNPGNIWVQDVAAYYNGAIAPAYSGGFTIATPTSLGGLGYAQGGARVALQPGIGNPTLSTVPVATQMQNYLTAHTSFNANQLVLIQGGPNDVLMAAEAIAANPTDPTLIAQEEGNVETAAIALAGVVGTALQNGATKVVVVNVPDIGKTPLGAGSATESTLLTSLSGGFNTALTAALNAGGILNKVIFIDAFTFVDTAVANPAANGFQVGANGTACNLTQMATSAQTYATQNPSVLQPGETAAEFGASLASSLFCSPQTLSAPGADQSYMFADTIHPTTHLHAVFAQYVEKQIAAAGIGH